ncbi:MAG: hypothetical protein M3P08_10725 [Thermoproteota archaeon]|nr:hypothetical protein [Thermoproteota archaeon]
MSRALLSIESLDNPQETAYTIASHTNEQMYEFYTGDKKYQKLLHKVKSMMYGESETAEYTVFKYKMKKNLVDIDIATSLIPDEDIITRDPIMALFCRLFAI